MIHALRALLAHRRPRSRILPLDPREEQLLQRHREQRAARRERQASERPDA